MCQENAIKKNSCAGQTKSYVCIRLPMLLVLSAPAPANGISLSPVSSATNKIHSYSNTISSISCDGDYRIQTGAAEGIMIEMPGNQHVWWRGWFGRWWYIYHANKRNSSTGNKKSFFPGPNASLLFKIAFSGIAWRFPTKNVLFEIKKSLYFRWKKLWWPSLFLWGY